MSEAQGNQARSGASTAWQIVGRLVASAVVLAITAFFTPGFTINRFRISGYCIICNSIFRSRIFYFLDGCHYWCFNLWCSWLLHSWKSVYVVIIKKSMQDSFSFKNVTYSFLSYLFLSFFYYFIFIFINAIFWNHTSNRR